MPDIKELYAFIERADTIEKAVIAADWFRERRNALSPQTYDILMKAVEDKMKSIFRNNWAKTFTPEGKVILIEKNTGEVIAEI